MSEDLKRQILNAVPDQADIRRRLAENLRERDFLRKMLRLANEKARVLEVGERGQVNG